MSKKKAAGKLKQQKRANPKYLGVKVSDGQEVGEGMVLVRQRGTKYHPGNGVRAGRDHTLFAVSSGTVSFGKKLGKRKVSIVS
ncbi:50S ribosomal protein L27 [Patescibacteria group bacterium]